jgi:hypothetical protein
MGIPEDPPEAPMTAEVPMATATDDVKSAPADAGRKKRTNILVATAIFAVIVITASVLIGVLVPQNNNGGSSSSSNNKSVEGSGGTEATDPPGTDPQVTIAPIVEFEYYQSVGPLSLQVPISSPNNVGVFDNEEQAKSAISDAALFLINNALLRNTGQKGFQNVALGGANRGQGNREPVFGEPVFEAGVDDAGIADAPTSGAAAQDTADDLGNANGYDTNNQEDKVDQADVSKSDGKFIYTAVGDYLVVMRAEKVGDWTTDPDVQLVTKLQMPQIEWPEQDSGCYYGGPYVDYIFAEPESPPEVKQAEPAFAADAIMPGYGCRPPKPSIQSLLLSENRIGVVVSGYGDRFRAELDEPTVLGDFLGTHLRLYDTSSLDTTGELTLLGVQDVHGSFSEGYMIGDVAHIVTMTYVNTWDYVISPVERWNPAFAKFDADEYLATVAASAQQTADTFSDQVIKELSLSTGVLPKTATIGLDIDGGLSDEPGFENVLFGDGYLNSMVQISSFDASQASVTSETAALEEPELELKQTVKFLPTSWAQVYSASDKLVVAGQGSRWVSSRRGSEETTHLFTFDLSGTVVTPEASGTVPGSLLNEYSIDYVGGYLRVATTIRNFWFADVVFRSGGFVPPVSVMTSEGDPGGRALQEERFEFVPTCTDVSDTCADESSMESCTRVESDCLQSELFYSTESCKFFCLADYEDSLCPLPNERCLTVANFWNCQSLVTDGCQNILIPESCPFGKIQCADDEQKTNCPIVDTNCFDVTAQSECIAMELVCENMFIQQSDDGCKVEFRCDDELVEVEEPESRTLNQLFVLKISDTNSTKLEIVGDVSLGEPNEGTLLKSASVFRSIYNRS